MPPQRTALLDMISEAGALRLKKKLLQVWEKNRDNAHGFTTVPLAACFVFFRPDREWTDINIIAQYFDEYRRSTASPGPARGIHSDNIFVRDLL